MEEMVIKIDLICKDWSYLRLCNIHFNLWGMVVMRLVSPLKACCDLVFNKIEKLKTKKKIIKNYKKIYKNPLISILFFYYILLFLNIYNFFFLPHQ